MTSLPPDLSPLYVWPQYQHSHHHNSHCQKVWLFRPQIWDLYVRPLEHNSNQINSITVTTHTIITVTTHTIITVTKDTTSSSKVRYRKTKPNCIWFPQFLNHILQHMNGKYVSVFIQEYVLDQWEAFSHGCVVLISFHFPLQSSEFYWPFGLFFW